MKKRIVLYFLVLSLILLSSCSIAKGNTINEVRGKWIHETTYYDTEYHDALIVSLEIVGDKVIITSLEDGKTLNKEYIMKSLDHSKFTIEGDNNIIQYDYKINPDNNVLNLYYEIQDSENKIIVHEVYTPDNIE